MNAENRNVMNKEVIELFNGKYCDVLISNDTIGDQDISFCAVGYDEEESLLIINKNGVHFELDVEEIDCVGIDNEEETEFGNIILTFSDGTTIVIRPLGGFEARQRYAHELLMLEFTRDRYKRELLKGCED